ncbi:hypothetical protein AGIG_G11061 [Arapaima gigas]
METTAEESLRSSVSHRKRVPSWIWASWLRIADGIDARGKGGVVRKVGMGNEGPCGEGPRLLWSTTGAAKQAENIGCL